MVWRGVFIIVATMLPAQSAEAKTCHHYSLWRYPFPQANCRTTIETPRRTQFVEIAPDPARTPVPAPEVEAPAKAQAIKTLEQELLWRAAQSLTLEETHGD